MINLEKKVFFLNKISFKKISFLRSLIKIESFNNSYCDSLGNFLRRVMFLTTFNYKIIYIKFFNINSKFSNLKGVKENTIYIINNINNILIKIENDSSAFLIIKKKGPCIIKAKDIFSDKKIIILNPNIVIANVVDDSIFFVLMKCVNTSYNFNKKNIINKIFKSKVIKINFIKSSITNINYFIHKKIFNKKIKNLFFDIETDGTVTPEECFKNCIFYIKKYFDLFFSILGKKKIKKIKKNNFLKINPILIRSVDNLEFSIKTSNILKNNNIFLIGDLIKMSEQKLFNLKEMNKNIFLEITNSLKNKKLNLNTKIEYEIQF
ncbi:DNA-directed RNA polymerase subunit alpha C-terminal domain-containing protein [Candidatus Carsonella ruddii]|uniref:DNA-directed RNA polymerase subunit alpha C-terminal domain-containing protein n=1 Tax=Carsonella ruddii TaxID=114186 RepID=UPI003D9A40C2